MIQEGQVYTTGSVRFEIAQVIYVTEFFSKIYFRLLDAGAFSKCLIDWSSKELELGLALGQISLVSKPLTDEKE